MAWNTLTYACGHTESVQLYGKHSERDRVVAAAAAHNCPACRAAAAQKAAASAGLPLLVGSDKQVAWAGEIRAKKMPAFDALLVKANGAFAALMPEQQVAQASQLAKIEAAVAQVKGQTRAAWWIDHQHDDARTLIVGIAGKL